MGNGPRIRCMEEVVNVLSIVLGTLYYASAKPAYEGQWIDDKFEGEGTLYNEFPQALVGQFDCRDMEEVGEYNIHKK